MTKRETLLDHILAHVPFDGWCDGALRAGARDAGMSDADLNAVYPRGPVDAALDYHRRGDRLMAERLGEEDLSGLKYRERVALAVRFRLEVADRELVRRGMALFALPQNAATGSGALWDTASAIWEALGDTSRDINWYTKRMSLSAVYSATLLYWLGDDSDGHAASWEFLDRRIGDVMAFEGTKARFRESGLGKLCQSGPGRFLGMIQAPGSQRSGYPGWRRNP